jgi:hypothetical protein
MWRAGAGGSIPSMAAYVFSVTGIFRLVRGALSRDRELDGAGRITAWGAAIVYGANPNLIYMQSTAMTEVLYLALFIWAVVYFSEFVRRDRKALTKCGLCVAAACLTRYDGWLLAGVTAAAAIAIAAPNSPLLWLAYNAAVYRNPLEFANGPYSAQAIAKKSATINPAAGSVYAGAAYFLKAAELNLAEKMWLERLWLALAGLGLLAVRADWKRWWPTLLLAIPIPFYALSLAYGGVPIFVPPGGRFPITTCATDCNYYRRWRCLAHWDCYSW